MYRTQLYHRMLFSNKKEQTTEKKSQIWMNLKAILLSKKRQICHTLYAYFHLYTISKTITL